MKKKVSIFISCIIPLLIGIVICTKLENTDNNEEAIVAAENETTITTEATPIEFSGPLQCMSPSSVNWLHNKEGSAVYLSGRTGIVTILVGDKSTSWMKNDIMTINKKISIAAEYLKKCGKQYGQEVELIYLEQDLTYYEWYEGNLAKWEENNYGETSYAWIEKDIDSEELIEKYNLDGLAYLFILNESGISYAIPHMVEDKEVNYYECAFVYLYDAESPDVYEPPAAYAHELLHLFGAVDLYKTNDNDGVSLDFKTYVEQKYNNDIMYTTFMSGNVPVQDEITNEMSILTAYTLGWVDEQDVVELKIYPEFKKEYAACWSERDTYSANLKEVP